MLALISVLTHQREIRDRQRPFVVGYIRGVGFARAIGHSGLLADLAAAPGAVAGEDDLEEDAA